jgi:hypothetical protein
VPPRTGMLGGVQQVGAGPFHIMCCTISSSRVSAAAATPVPIPVSNTANQKGPRRDEPAWKVSCHRWLVAAFETVAGSHICFYPNTGANDIETRPRTKRVNISASKRLTSLLAPRNSFHTKTPQTAEIMVLPSPSENEVAGPTMGV